MPVEIIEKELLCQAVQASVERVVNTKQKEKFA
jgi:hypothetical protein